MLHAAAVFVAVLHLRQFFVRVGADAVAIKLHGLPRGLFKRRYTLVTVLMKNPSLQRHTGGRAEVARSKLRHANVVQPRGNRRGLSPMRYAASIAEVDLFLKDAVRHHLISRWRGDDELAGGFVVGVIDGGQPLAGEVGPVGAEHSPLAVLILHELQAGSG